MRGKNSFRCIITALLAFAILILPLYFSIRYNVQISMVVFVSIITVLIIIYADKISEVSLGKLTLRLREKINEAEKITNSLRQLAKVWAEITINDLVKSGSTDYLEISSPICESNAEVLKNLPTPDRIIEQVTNTLKEIGFSSDEVSAILQPWTRFKLC